MKVLVFMMIVVMGAGCASNSQTKNKQSIPSSIFSRNVDGQGSAEDEVAVTLEDKDDKGIGVSSPESVAKIINKAEFKADEKKYVLKEVYGVKLQSTEFDIPVVDNRAVRKWIDYFTGKGRKWFKVYMTRSPHFIPFLKEQLQKNNMPSDLVYLSMIESGFNTNAKSHASAVGPWQFIKGTGKRYGLDADFWLDERIDRDKSTLAAINYLKELYAEFDSWELSAASYNAGEGKVRRAIAMYKSKNFWEISQKKFLKPETRDYVPKWFAAAIIAKNAEQFGFEKSNEIVKEETQFVEIKVPLNLTLLADALNMSVGEIRSNNPELLKWCTPPYAESYFLRLPTDKKLEFVTKEKQIYASAGVVFDTYRTKSGDSIAKLSKKFRVTKTSLQKMNPEVSQSSLKAGRKLILPTPALNEDAGIHIAELRGDIKRSLASIPESDKKAKKHKKAKHLKKKSSIRRG